MRRTNAVGRAVALAAMATTVLSAGSATAQEGATQATAPTTATAPPATQAATPAAAPAVAPSTIGTGTTSLADAVSLALRQNPDALTSESQVRHAEAARDQVRGTFLPKVHVDANLQEWNSPFGIPFGGSTFLIRDQFTWTFSPSLIQPLTGLWSIYDDYKVADYGVDVATIKRRAQRRDIAFLVARRYYRLLEAERLAEVADASVSQLEAQQKVAKSQFDNGVIGKNDLLRAQLALANARQRAIQQRGAIEIARGELNTAIGASPDADFEPVPFNGDPPPVADASLQDAEGRAAGQRLELLEYDREIGQADHEASAAKKKYVPQVNAIANYTHLGGQPFSPENSEYVGVFASWDVWDWGATQGAVNAAHERVEQERIARKKMEDQVRIEAREAFVNARTAREALDVARTAVDQAEENYRIVSKKFEANAATSFDVVDAESVLTGARGQVQSALYNYLIARAALERATGTPLPGEH